MHDVVVVLLVACLVVLLRSPVTSFRLCAHSNIYSPSLRYSCMRRFYIADCALFYAALLVILNTYIYSILDCHLLRTTMLQLVLPPFSI